MDLAWSENIFSLKIFSKTKIITSYLYIKYNNDFNEARNFRHVEVQFTDLTISIISEDKWKMDLIDRFDQKLWTSGDANTVEGTH